MLCSTGLVPVSLEMELKIILSLFLLLVEQGGLEEGGRRSAFWLGLLACFCAPLPCMQGLLVIPTGRPVACAGPHLQEKGAPLAAGPAPPMPWLFSL